MQKGSITKLVKPKPTCNFIRAAVVTTQQLYTILDLANGIARENTGDFAMRTYKLDKIINLPMA